MGLHSETISQKDSSKVEKGKRSEQTLLQRTANENMKKYSASLAKFTFSVVITKITEAGNDKEAYFSSE